MLINFKNMKLVYILTSINVRFILIIEYSSCNNKSNKIIPVFNVYTEI